MAEPGRVAEAVGAPRAPLGAGSAFAVLIAVAGAQFAGGFVGGVVSGFAGLTDGFPVLVIGCSMVAGGAVALLLAHADDWRLLRAPITHDSGTSVPARACVLAAAGGVALSCGWMVAADAFMTPPESTGPLVALAETPGLDRLMWAGFVLSAPVVEEWAFRGVLLAGLRTRFGVTTSVAVTSLLFVAAHGSETVYFWPATIPILGVAVATALLRVRTGSLAPAIAMHFAYNAALVVYVYGAD